MTKPYQKLEEKEGLPDEVNTSSQPSESILTDSEIDYALLLFVEGLRRNRPLIDQIKLLLLSEAQLL